MPISLSPGRYCGLKNASLPDADAFGIVAFDQRGSYRKMMGADASYAQLCQVKTEIIDALSQSASAVLTDPIYGMGAALSMTSARRLAAGFGKERLQRRFQLSQNRAYHRLDSAKDPPYRRGCRQIHGLLSPGKAARWQTSWKR